jgi:hypothetical protein
VTAPHAWILLTSLTTAAAVLVQPARPRLSHGPGAARRRPDPAARPALSDLVVTDLVCAALSAGLPTAAAVAAAHAVAGGVAPERSLLLTRALALADRTGASAVVLLQRAAADERAARRRAVATATGRLGVRLVIPLGLTVLPAFVLLGIAPVVLGLGQQILQPP